MWNALPVPSSSVIFPSSPSALYPRNNLNVNFMVASFAFTDVFLFFLLCAPCGLAGEWNSGQV